MEAPVSTAVLRALDASANRAREALRVVEDYVRFVLDDRHLTERLKNLRHELAHALAGVPVSDRLAARNTLEDVGTSLTADAETRRESPENVLTANFMRLQEALRSLEEFGKIHSVEIAESLKQLRYEAYSLHRAVGSEVASVERLASARLYLLMDGRESPDTFAEFAKAVIAAGVDVVQLRDKGLCDRELLARARMLREITAASGKLMIVNDRPELALLSGADGVHVGQDELTVAEARAVVGPRSLIGVSAHSLQQARQAVADGASYIGVGPTYPSRTKHFNQFAGLELLRCVAAEIRLPAFAIGGIGMDNLAEVLATGVARVAVGAAVCSASDPVEAARRLRRGLDAAVTDEAGE